MLENGEDKFMKRCLDLAGRAEGMTYPNPLVGSVLVHNGLIIGEGYHIRSGEPHAEAIAINSVKDKSLIKQSTLFVSLEPCTHFGKTPPCTDLIIDLHIPKIVIGTRDTSSKVSGRGIEQLIAAGREVITGVCEDECRRINRRFFTFHEKKRPYITLKWAQSADGFIDIIRPEGSGTGPYWISGNSERVLVHKWRSVEQAVLVGAGTVRRDNPALNVRYWKGKDPVRLILSDSGDMGKYFSKSETNGTVIAFTGNKKADLGDVQKVVLKRDYPSSVQIAGYLYELGIQSLLIEGGAMVLNHFIKTGLWDEARVFSGFRDFTSGVKAPEISGKMLSRSGFHTSRLEVLLNE